MVSSHAGQPALKTSTFLLLMTSSPCSWLASFRTCWAACGTARFDRSPRPGIPDAGDDERGDIDVDGDGRLQRELADENAGRGCGPDTEWTISAARPGSPSKGGERRQEEDGANGKEPAVFHQDRKPCSAEDSGVSRPAQRAHHLRHQRNTDPRQDSGGRLPSAAWLRRRLLPRGDVCSIRTTKGLSDDFDARRPAALVDAAAAFGSGSQPTDVHTLHEDGGPPRPTYTRGRISGSDLVLLPARRDARSREGPH